MPPIHNKHDWDGLPDTQPLAGDIMIKKVFDIEGNLERAIVWGQKVQGVFQKEGSSSSEHAAICIGPNFVAEAEGSGIVANSLATDDRKHTLYLVYRCSNRDITSEASHLAEMVARGRNNLTYDNNARHTGGGYALSAGIGAMVRPISPHIRLAMHAAAPSYLKNIIDYAQGRTNDRMWAFCSMFACAVYEAACIIQDGGFDRNNYQQGPTYRQYALKLNPYHVTPRMYEDALNKSTHYKRVGKFCFEKKPFNLSQVRKPTEVFEGLRQAVEDYHKTHRGGGVGGGQALKIRFGLRRVSPESQKALEELTKDIKVCESNRKAPARFRESVDWLCLHVSHYLQYDIKKIAHLLVSERGKPSSNFRTSQVFSADQPLKKGSTFYKILSERVDKLSATLKPIRLA